MPALEVPRYELLERLLSLVAAENAALLPGCRWLVLGPKLAAIVAPDEAPTLDDLTALLRLLRRQTPDLQSLGRTLAGNSEHGEAAYVEICVDRLLEVPGWHHPTQVLERPRPDFRQLLEASRARSKAPGGSGLAELGSVVARLEKAVSIAEDARARRERMRRDRKRT